MRLSKMNFIELIFLAIALAMDAFSVSLNKGFSQKNLKNHEILLYGLFFGGFQFLMPLIGYICGSSISSLISVIAPWIAFILLVGIGCNMIHESLGDSNESYTDEFSFKELILLSIATSIDAFAVGITFAILNTELWFSISIIGVVAFLFGICGVFIGRKIGDYFGDKLQVFGGVILIILGLKILLGL